jgi:hypothetical protein
MKMKTQIVSALAIGMLAVTSLMLRVPPAHAQSLFAVQDGIGVGGVFVNQTLAQAEAVWGPPDDQSPGDDDMHYTWYRHPGDITVIVESDGRISMLFATGNAQFQTPTGLAVKQSAMADVRLRYGEPEEIKSYGSGTITWMYWHRGISVTFYRTTGVIEHFTVYASL